MGLWLEHRDADGSLIERAKCTDGHFVLMGDGGVEPFSLAIADAQALAKISNGLPPEKRDWVLRIDYGSDADQDY